jgi:hypothetical protein
VLKNYSIFFLVLLCFGCVDPVEQKRAQARRAKEIKSVVGQRILKFEEKDFWTLVITTEDFTKIQVKGYKSINTTITPLEEINDKN